MNSTVLKAIAIILFGIAAFDIMGVIVRLLGNNYPILQISVLRNLFGIIPSIVILMLGPGISDLKKINTVYYWKIIIIRGAVVLLAQFCFYTSLTKIEFATASSLGFTSPLFITLLSIPILSHKVGFYRIFAVCFGFLGVLAIFQPFNDGFTIWLILPVIAGFCYALSSILVRFFPDEIHSGSIQIGQQLVTALIGAVVLTAMGDFVSIETIKDAQIFLLLGLFGGIGVLSLVISYRMVEPSLLAPFEYFGIPISFILGWLFFAEAPFEILFPGVFFIVFAGMIIIYRESRNKL
jgi:drug/metabolite transporter (DMT)-like permease